MSITPLLEKKVDLLQTRIFSSREQMGAAAGLDVAERIQRLLQEQDIVRIIFAAAPSQNELLAHLANDQRIDWSRIDVFHMDEYIGLAENAIQRFSRFLNNHLFEKVKPRKVNLILDNDGLAIACARYKELLLEAPIDIVCLGVGENGHLAFNDPPVANFKDPEIIKEVTLDDACRQQQVNDGCFPSLHDVPEKALTLTIPMLLSAKYLYCVAPGKTKQLAINKLMADPISTACPASILRTHSHCVLYTDKDGYYLPSCNI
ncbi:MAG: glucosamine-6-phosphate deaminase [Chitinophagaceae bacterium]